MRHAHFLVLTGRLNEFPLHELVETLRGQRKTGRLLVEFKAGPAALYFREGALVDARMGNLRDLEALSLALSLQHEDAAAFNFNPLVAPPDAPHPAPSPEREPGPARDDPAAGARPAVIEVEPEAVRPWPAEALPSPAEPPPRALPPAPDDVLLAKLNRIEVAVAAQARRANVERAAYAAVIALVIAAGFFWRGGDSATRNDNRMNADAADARTPAALQAAPAALQSAPARTADAAANPPAAVQTAAGGGQAPAGQSPATNNATAAPPSNAARAPQQPPASAQGARAQNTRAARAANVRAAGADAGGHVVQVRMTVERGRVLRAEVSNPRPGMAAYEALALRMARQRRFPENFSGRETLRLKVDR